MVPLSKSKTEKICARDVLIQLWDAVSAMVVAARKASTTEDERRRFRNAALTARKLWKALNIEGASGHADSPWRPTVWTHIFLWHLPSVMDRHKTLAPFWQYGFENRHKREKEGYSNTFNVGIVKRSPQVGARLLYLSLFSGTSATTGKTGLESLLGADNLDLELWDLHGFER